MIFTIRRNIPFLFPRQPPRTLHPLTVRHSALRRRDAQRRDASELSAKRQYALSRRPCERLGNPFRLQPPSREPPSAKGNLPRRCSCFLRPMDCSVSATTAIPRAAPYSFIVRRGVVFARARANRGGFNQMIHLARGCSGTRGNNRNIEWSLLLLFLLFICMFFF